MIDEKGNKVKKMEVYIAVSVDVSDLKTVSEAYRRSGYVSDRLADLVDAEYDVTDSYEVFRDDDGYITEPEDSPVSSRNAVSRPVYGKNGMKTGKTSAKTKKPVRKPVNAKSKPKTGTNPSKTKKTVKRPVSAKRTATARRVTKR